MYRLLLRPVFFLFDPEKIHHFVFAGIRLFFKIPGIGALLRAIYQVKDPRLERKLFGITFPNPVGLAAGFDKDARLFDELGELGFGFVEIGTVTPVPQAGNEKPRLFRLPADQGLINRMGFNNDGAAAAAEQLKKRKTGIIIGGNIGKNKNTPNENAAADYEKCFEILYPVVDFFVVNVSSPNTPGLRELQEKGPLTELLLRLKKLNASKPKPRPLLLKIAPDLSDQQLDEITEIVKNTGIDGVVATNTTISRDGLKTTQEKLEKIGPGGLSGKPLFERSLEVIRYLSKKSGNSFPIIGVGGVHKAEDALAMLQAGASLVQIYTGFIYEGPGLAKKINRKILASRQSIS